MTETARISDAVLVPGAGVLFQTGCTTPDAAASHNFAIMTKPARRISYVVMGLGAGVLSQTENTTPDAAASQTTSRKKTNDDNNLDLLEIL